MLSLEHAETEGSWGHCHRAEGHVLKPRKPPGSGWISQESCLFSKTQAHDRWFSCLVSHRLCEAGVAVPHFTDWKAEVRY